MCECHMHPTDDWQSHISMLFVRPAWSKRPRSSAATKVHDICWNATRSAWLHPSFGGEDGVQHLCSLLKPSALPDRRHQPLIIGSAVAPALRCHAAAVKTRRRRRPVRRRPRPEDLMGRPQSAGLARWSGGWARRAAWEVAGGARRARSRGLVRGSSQGRDVGL